MALARLARSSSSLSAAAISSSCKLLMVIVVVEYSITITDKDTPVHVIYIYCDYDDGLKSWENSLSGSIDENDVDAIQESHMCVCVYIVCVHVIFTYTFYSYIRIRSEFHTKRGRDATYFLTKCIYVYLKVLL